MTDDHENYDLPIFRRAIDSTVMIAFARFFMPIVLAIVGYFMTTALSDIKIANKEVWVQLSKLNDTQAAAQAVQSGLAVRVEGVVKQLDHLQVQVDTLPRR